VPRLSLIVPFQHDNVALEKTLVSILESREADYELLIVHNGAYRDPYQLGNDEAIVVESPHDASLVDQLNLAVGAACAGVIQVLLPDTTVEHGWAFDALELMMQRPDLHAVCMPIEDPNTKVKVVGIDGAAIPHRRVTEVVARSHAPLACGGMFRRKTLLQLGGWFNQSSLELAELEFAILVGALEFAIGTTDHCGIRAKRRIAAGIDSGFEMGKASGMLAHAFGEIADSGVQVDSLARRLGHLASGLMNPKSVAERLGWVLGVRDRSWVSSIRNRFDSAVKVFAPTSSVLPMQRSRESTTATRRAA
jgi:hypothetical protein